MVEKVIVTFGDSWTYGYELSEDTRKDAVYGKKLAALLGYDTHINFGKPASGIGEMVIELDRFLSSSEFSPEKQYFFVFGVTTSARSLGFSNKLNNWFEILPVEYQNKHEMEIAKFSIANIINRKYECMMSNIYLAAIQSACLKNNIKFLMFSVFESVNYELHAGKQLLDSRYFYNFGNSISEELGLPKTNFTQGHDYLCKYISETQNQYFVPNATHPNKLGHEFMANRLYDWIKQHIDT